MILSCTFWHTNPCPLKNVHNSPKGIHIAYLSNFHEIFELIPSSSLILLAKVIWWLTDWFGESVCNNFSEICWKKNTIGKKAKDIKKNEDKTLSRGKSTKLPLSGGEGNGKEKSPSSPEYNSDSDEIYVTPLTTFESEGVHHDPQTVASYDEDLVAWKWELLRS